MQNAITTPFMNFPENTQKPKVLRLEALSLSALKLLLIQSTLRQEVKNPMARPQPELLAPDQGRSWVECASGTTRTLLENSGLGLGHMCS